MGFMVPDSRRPEETPARTAGSRGIRLLSRPAEDWRFLDTVHNALRMRLCRLEKRTYTLYKPSTRHLARSTSGLTRSASRLTGSEGTQTRSGKRRASSVNERKRRRDAGLRAALARKALSQYIRVASFPMLLKNTERGLFCSAGNFHIDPWRPVDFAIITHAHSDHARAGSRNYLTATPGTVALRNGLARMRGSRASHSENGWCVNGVAVSFHPAGHILGSAQIRLERGGEIWVVSGDYKTECDGISGTFEPVRCHTFVTESTFALPIYRWRPQAEIFSEINDWWRENQAKERTSVLFAYSLGKSQRVLSGLDGSIGPIFLHGAVRKICRNLRKSRREVSARRIGGCCRGSNRRAAGRW